MLKKYGTLAKVLEAMKASGKQPYPLEKVQKEIEGAKKHRIKILLHADAEYPETLLNSYDPAPVLFYKGNLELLNKRAVGIVGKRNASANGCALTKPLSADLGAAGIVVISGLGRGIDAEAHKAALETGPLRLWRAGLMSVTRRKMKSCLIKLLRKDCLFPKVRSYSSAGAPFPAAEQDCCGIKPGCADGGSCQKIGLNDNGGFCSQGG